MWAVGPAMGDVPALAVKRGEPIDKRFAGLLARAVLRCCRPRNEAQCDCKHPRTHRTLLRRLLERARSTHGANIQVIPELVGSVGVEQATGGGLRCGPQRVG